jgi:hypothetical protein
MLLEDVYAEYDLWLDRNQLIKTQIENQDSGNGILYLSVAIALIYEMYGDTSLKQNYVSAVSACFKKPGLLMRNPTGSFGLESWDDYLGVAVVCIIIHNRAIPRKILWYGLKHFGCYNNTNSFTWESFLWRFPQVWMLMTIAAFPWTKHVLKYLLDVSALFVHSDVRNPSGVQLAWMFEYGIRAAGFKVPSYKTVSLDLPVAFERYYQKGHFFHHLAKAVAIKSSLKENA